MKLWTCNIAPAELLWCGKGGNGWVRYVPHCRDVTRCLLLPVALSESPLHAPLPSPLPPLSVPQALQYDRGTHITSTGALATLSGAKTGRSPK